MKYTLPKFVIWIVTSTTLPLLLACNKSSDRSLPNPNEPVPPPLEASTVDQKLSEVPGLRMRIFDAGKFRQLVAGRSDKPKFYAVRGAVVDGKRALVAFRKGGTLCYTRIANYRLRSGQVIHVNSLRGGKSESVENMFFVTASHTDSETNSAVAVVCMKLNSPIRVAEANHALRGIVEFQVSDRALNHDPIGFNE